MPYRVIFHTCIKTLHMATAMSGHCVGEMGCGLSTNLSFGVTEVEKDSTPPHLVSTVTRLGSACSLFRLATTQPNSTQH